MFEEVKPLMINFGSIELWSQIYKIKLREVLKFFYSVNSI